MKPTLEQFCRLAFRIEGKNWVAYFAPTDSMKGAVLLGSVQMNLVHGNGPRKEQFMAFMRDCFGDVCQEIFGTRPEWKELVPAPQHERSSNA